MGKRDPDLPAFVALGALRVRECSTAKLGQVLAIHAHDSYFEGVYLGNYDQSRKAMIFRPDTGSVQLVHAQRIAGNTGTCPTGEYKTAIDYFIRHAKSAYDQKGTLEIPFLTVDRPGPEPKKKKFKKSVKEPNPLVHVCGGINDILSEGWKKQRAFWYYFVFHIVSKKGFDF